MGGALGSYYWPCPPSPPQHSGAAGRSEQGPQPVICTWAQASVAPNRYLRMCFLLKLAAVLWGQGGPGGMWRANACPSWLFAPLAGRLVWDGMGQALAFFGVWVPTWCRGHFNLLRSVPSWFPQCPRSGHVSSLDGGVKGYLSCVGGGTVLVPLLPSRRMTWLPGMELVP